MNTALQAGHNTYKWLTAKTIDNHPWCQMKIKHHVKRQIGFANSDFSDDQIELTKKIRMSGVIQIPFDTCSPSSLNKNGIYSILLRRRHTYVSAERYV